MKKSIFGLGLLTCAVAFAGVGNKVVTFSTPGIDKYADGTMVLDGECYALVWTKSGATFNGIDTDGKAVGDAADVKVLLRAPVAKGGRCPFIKFEIDENYWANNTLGNGSLAVYLLDTRKYQAGADGVLVKDGAGDFIVESCGKKGNPVNGFGNTGATVNVGGGVTSAVAGCPVLSGTPSAAAGDAVVKVDKIDFVDDKVYLHVTGTASTALYGVASGTTPDKLVDDGERRYGQMGQEMIIVRDQKAGGEFFQVNRK